MGLNPSSSTLARLAHFSVAILSAVVLTACGGTGSAPGKVDNIPVVTSSTSTTLGTINPKLTLSLANAAGVNTNTLTLSSPLTVKATLLDQNGKAIPNAVVTFGTAGTYTTIAPASAATLTNASGVATVTLSAKDLLTIQAESGTADTISAAATVGANTATATVAYQLGSAAVSLSLVSAASVDLAAYGTTIIKVKVLADGQLYTKEPVTINFSSNCAGSDHAVLPATATTVNGQAQVVYTDKGCGSTDSVTASLIGAQSVIASIVVAPPVGSSISFVSGLPSDQAIVIKGSGGIGRSETATLTFRALDTSGQPLVNQLVKFVVTPGDLVTLQTPQALSDSNGMVVTTVNSGTTATTFRVIAFLAASPDIFSVSSTVTVTTGVPIQAAFSLSASSHNIEGWDIDNVTTSVNILMADAAGNPVADGTPVVFSTDSGAIGSASNGGCVTTNGGCSVSFRSQAPRYGVGNVEGKRAGLATISVSSVTAYLTLQAKTGIFLSGSSADNVYYSGTATQVVEGANNVISTAACGTYNLRLELNDQNFNPLPKGSTIAVENASSDLTVGTILPGTVPDRGPHDASGSATLVVADMVDRQGTNHAIPIALPATVVDSGGVATGGCYAPGLNTAVGSFDVTVTTPQGTPKVYHFSLSYKVP